jgi:hypothetical protein
MTVMKLIPILASFFLLSGCLKENIPNRNAQRMDFFSSEKDAISKMQKHVTVYDQAETVEKILSVSYIDSRTKSYAFVFYVSNRGPGNMVIEQQYNGPHVMSIQSIKCTGPMFL